MRFVLRLCIVLGISSVAPAVFAADGSSGCGPAWYVFKDNSLVSSVVRAVTNTVLFPSSTLGMTFGTSNCAKHKIVLQEKESLHLATMAYNDLMIQTARGQGEHLAALAHTLGCDARAQDEFNRTMQASFDALFPGNTEDPSLVVKGAVERIRLHPSLAMQCEAGLG